MAYLPPLPPVKLNDDFASPGLASLVAAVAQAVGDRGRVIFGVKASSLVAFGSRRSREPMTWQTDVAERTVDVVVCDPKTLKPLAAAATDGDVRKLLEAAGIKCLDAEGDVASVASDLVAAMRE